MEFLEFCQRMMPQGKRVGYYRADNASYEAGVINFCFGHQMLFTITADQDRAVKEAIKARKKEAGQQRYGQMEYG